MALVKGLRDLQGAPRGKTEAIVRFALQSGQIVETRRSLARRLFLLRDFGDRLALAGREHGFRCRLFPDAIDPVMLVVLVLLEIRPLINAFVGSLLNLELRGHPPVVARLEICESPARD